MSVDSSTEAVDMLQPKTSQTWLVSFEQSSADDLSLHCERHVNQFCYHNVKVSSVENHDVVGDNHQEKHHNDMSSCDGICAKETAPETNMPVNVRTESSVTCNSPESGFGSEHQYSPKASTWSFSESQTSDEPRDLPQILSVTSLAEKADTAQVLEKTRASKKRHASCKATEKHNFPLKRLQMRRICSKYTMELDWTSDRTPEKETNSKDTFTRILDDTRITGHANHRILFGLPALTCCRHKLSKVADLQLCENWPIERCDTQCPQIPQPPSLCTESSIVSTPEPEATKFGNITDTLCTKNSNLSDTTKVKSPKVEGTSSAKARSFVTTVEKGKSETQVQKISQKAVKLQAPSRIDRLKEILRKREEDLEKVRRSCGFIS